MTLIDIQPIIFQLIWAPTLLQMAGASKDLITGNKEGSTFGKKMWSYIKNSVVNRPPTSQDNKPINQNDKSRIHLTFGMM